VFYIPPSTEAESLSSSSPSCLDVVQHVKATTFTDVKPFGVTPNNNKKKKTNQPTAFVVDEKKL
jgi:hypothetical protein